MKALISLVTILASLNALAVDISSVCDDEMKYGKKFKSHRECMRYHGARSTGEKLSNVDWSPAVKFLEDQETKRVQVDNKCYRDCRSAGYEDGLCEKKCSY